MRRSFLWQDRQIVPFLKIDKGLAQPADGVQLMKPIPDVDALLHRALRHGMLGTKMRSVVALADPVGNEAVVGQQFAVARRVLHAGLVPIIEPEVDIHSPQKLAADELLTERLLIARLGRTTPPPAQLEAPVQRQHGSTGHPLNLCGVGRCSFLGSLHDAPASDGPETVACALLSAEPVVRMTDQRRRRDGVGGALGRAGQAWFWPGRQAPSQHALVRPRLASVARSGVSLQPMHAKRGSDHAASRAGASDGAGHRGACCPSAGPRGVSGSSDECTGASGASSLSRPPAAS